MNGSKGLNLDSLACCSATLDATRRCAPGLPVLENAARRKLNVCVASHDFVGPIRNGGIGTACTTIAETLAGAGHRVTALYLTPTVCETGSIAHWTNVYREKGIDFVGLPPAPVAFNGSFAVSKAYDCFAWLRWREFDVVHSPELMGALYFCLAAKRQGLAFEKTQFVVGTHSPTLWHLQGNRELSERFEDIERDFLERECVARADVVWSPSQYLLDWERSRDWKHPERTYVQPYPVPTDIECVAGGEMERRPVDELVFFGRLEARKGLILFCDAVDRLCASRPDLAGATRITFLGKGMTVGNELSIDYIRRRSRQWPLPTNIENQRDRNQALDYLKQPGRLAVMPSLMDNSPLAVVECLAAGIPFLASNAGGIPEQIAAEDHDDVLVPLRADRLGAALERAIDQGARTARFAVDPATIKDAWIAWHEQLPLAADRPAAPAAPQPLVTICMAHHNRPHLLSQAIDSIRRQDYPHIELILVDDASTAPAATAALDALEADFATRGWTLIRRPDNQFACAARNLAATRARGRFLMFMDDDNVAKPHEVSTLVKAAQSSDADIVCCFHDAFRGEKAPGVNDAPELRHPFLGPAVSLSVWHNALGDTNMLIRSEVFEALGGFTEEYGVGHEDREMLARAVLQGYQLEVVPEALFWYRWSPESLTETTTMNSNHLRAIRPYLDVVPEPVRPVLLLAQGLLHRAHAAEERVRQLASVQAHAPQPAPPPPHEPALRHRLADRLNHWAKRVPLAHPVAKSMVVAGRRAWRFARGRKPYGG